MTNCANCSVELIPEIGNPETEYQFENALWVGFFGGYGMFVDDIDTEYGYKRPMLKGSAEEAVICHKCAHELCEATPWIKKLLRPERAHSHTEEFWKENPEHEGWDREPALERIRKAIQKSKDTYPNG